MARNCACPPKDSMQESLPCSRRCMPSWHCIRLRACEKLGRMKKVAHRNWCSNLLEISRLYTVGIACMKRHKSTCCQSRDSGRGQAITKVIGSSNGRHCGSMLTRLRLDYSLLSFYRLPITFEATHAHLLAEPPQIFPVMKTTIQRCQRYFSAIFY